MTVRPKPLVDITGWLTDAGELLRHRRIALGLSQADVATHLGITQGSVSRIENGKNSSLTLQLLADAAAFLGVDVELVFTVPG